MRRYLSLFLFIGVVIISALTIQNISLQQQAFSLSSGVSVPTYSPTSSSSSNTGKTPTNNPSSSSPSSTNTSSSFVPSYTPSPTPSGVTPPPSSVSTPGAPSTLPQPPSEFIHLTKTLAFGMNDYEVTLLQKVLVQEGLFTLTPTGYFGPRTLEGVMNFQRRYGIPSIGIVGPLTRAKINAGMYLNQSTTTNPVDGKAGVNALQQ